MNMQELLARLAHIEALCGLQTALVNFTDEQLTYSQPDRAIAGWDGAIQTQIVRFAS